MRISIDQKVLEDVLGYMVTQPYKDVAQLLAAVQQDAKPIVQTEPEKEQDKSNE